MSTVAARRFTASGRSCFVVLLGRFLLLFLDAVDVFAATNGTGVFFVLVLRAAVLGMLAAGGEGDLDGAKIAF